MIYLGMTTLWHLSCSSTKWEKKANLGVVTSNLMLLQSYRIVKITIMTRNDKELENRSRLKGNTYEFSGTDLKTLGKED